jgi:hypothetical protein
MRQLSPYGANYMELTNSTNLAGEVVGSFSEPKMCGVGPIPGSFNLVATAIQI